MRCNLGTPLRVLAFPSARPTCIYAGSPCSCICTARNLCPNNAVDAAASLPKGRLDDAGDAVQCVHPSCISFRTPNLRLCRLSVFLHLHRAQPDAAANLPKGRLDDAGDAVQCGHPSCISFRTPNLHLCRLSVLLHLHRAQPDAAANLPKGRLDDAGDAMLYGQPWLNLPQNNAVDAEPQQQTCQGEGWMMLVMRCYMGSPG